MSRRRRSAPRPAPGRTPPPAPLGHTPAEIEDAAPGFMYPSASGGDQYSQSLAAMAATVDTHFEPTRKPSSFGPGVPASTTPLDDTGEPRQYQYRQGWNLPALPGEGRPLDMSSLRALADVYDILRKCIEVRKDELCSMSFGVIARETDRRKARQVVQDQQSTIREIETFFMFPDRRHTWQTWLRMLLEDYFVVDAASIWKHRDYGGRLISLRILDGALIKPMLSINGDTPDPPDTAYQQYVWGLPRWNFSAEELLYCPKNVRPNRAYGFSPVEQFLTHVTLSLRYQRFQLDFFCHSEDTEVLTDQGWKLFKDLDRTELFATWNPKSNALEYQAATDWVDKLYSGTMLEFANKSTAFCVTPNHTIVAKRRGSKEWRKFEAADFLRSGMEGRYVLPDSPSWEGTWSDDFVFGSHAPIPPIAWMEFLGLFLAEGFVTDDSVYVCQSTNNSKFCDVAEVVEATGLPFHYSAGRWSLSSKALAAELRRYGHMAWNKFLPADVKALHPVLLEAFLYGYCLGDGHQKSNGNRIWVTTSRQLAGDVQELLLKCGREGYLRQLPPQKNKTLKNGDVIIQRHTGYTVAEKSEPHYVPIPREIVYEGRVYCVTVPNHTLVTRYRGYNIISGQTDGTLPEGIAEAPASWSPKQLQDFNAIWDRMLAGDSRALHKLRFVPAGFKFHQFKQHTFDSEFARWLVGVTCAAFDLQPQELGFEPMHGGLGGRGFSEEQSIILKRKAVYPLQRWILDEIINPIIWEEFGASDLQGTFIDQGSSREQLQQMQARDLAIRNGTMSIDEAVEEDGGEPPGIDRIFVVGNLVYGTPDLLALSTVGAAALNISGTPPPEGSRPVPLGMTAAEQSSIKSGVNLMPGGNRDVPALPPKPGSESADGKEAQSQVKPPPTAAPTATPPPAKPEPPTPPSPPAEGKDVAVPSYIILDPTEAHKAAVIQVQSQQAQAQLASRRNERSPNPDPTQQRRARATPGPGEVADPDLTKAAIADELGKYSRFVAARRRRGSWRPFQSSILDPDLVRVLNRAGEESFSAA